MSTIGVQGVQSLSASTICRSSGLELELHCGPPFYSPKIWSYDVINNIIKNVTNAYIYIYMYIYMTTNA